MKHPIVFADLHHSSLFYSLKLLFEDRLGGTLFRPIGMEWFENGYWDLAQPYDNDINTVQQYLLIKPDYKPVDKSNPLNIVANEFPDYYEIEEIGHGYKQKAITWEQFQKIDFDYIVASIPDHATTYSKLRTIYKPSSKLIFQMGNHFSEVHDLMKDGDVKNLMSSTSAFPVPPFVNSVFYHQEQPIQNEFVPPPDVPAIKGYVHLCPEKDLYLRYKKALPDIEFKYYGALCPDGSLGTLKEIYESILSSSFVWHVKPFGDGFGWTWHNAFMLGRPVITNFSDYEGKLGGQLFEDGVTGIDLERRSLDENVALIKRILSDKEKHMKMCKSAYDRFREVVDYDRELIDIKAFLERLI